MKNLKLLEKLWTQYRTATLAKNSKYASILRSTLGRIDREEILIILLGIIMILVSFFFVVYSKIKGYD